MINNSKHSKKKILRKIGFLVRKNKKVINKRRKKGRKYLTIKK